MTTPTVHEAYTRFRAAMVSSGVPEGTRKQYAMVVRRVAARLPERHIGGLRGPDLNDLLYGPRGLCIGVAPTTATSYRTAVRKFLLYCQAEGWSTLTVPAPVFQGRRRRPAGAPTRLTEDELILMLDRCEHPVTRGMVAVAIGTALRWSDIRKIKTEDVNLTTGDLYVWVQKTGRFDAMPVSLDLEEEIRRYLGWYTSETGATLRTEGAYLFPGHTRGTSLGWVTDPSRMISYTTSTDRLKALLETCGIAVEPRESWHVIRRSVARIYFDRLRAEVSHDHALRQTAALLGHLNQETTEKYLGLQAEVRARDASIRGRSFIGGTPTNVRRIG